MEESKPFSGSRKRPLQRDIRDTPYYKMRLLLKELRPHFIEILKTPDFRNCKAADEIRQGINRMMELYREWTENPVKLEKCSNGDIGDAKKTVEENEEDVKPDVKPEDNPLLDDVMSVLPPENQEQGSVVIGGSAFGWNFITYHSCKAVFYGRTKEAFRAVNPKSV